MHRDILFPEKYSEQEQIGVAGCVAALAAFVVVADIAYVA
jgi:hypothetical protein